MTGVRTRASTPPRGRWSSSRGKPNGAGARLHPGCARSVTDALLGLQQTAGNQAVHALHGALRAGGTPVLQRFLASYVGKEFEIDEADAKVRNEDGTPRTWSTGEAIPEGKQVGDPVVVPRRTKVKVLGTKGQGDGRLVQVDGWGWTKAKNLGGDLHGETLGMATASYLSTDAAHKTVGNPKATIRVKGTTYPPTKSASVIPEGTVVKISATAADGITVRLAGLDDVDLGWTRKGNIAATAGGQFQVKDAKAVRRVETTSYGPTKTTIAIGALVVVEETDPTGAYVRVAGVKDDAGKKTKGDEIGWTTAANLVNGWTADIHAATATWEKGAFTGQIDVVDIVDEGGDTEQIADQTLSPFQQLQAAAKAAGHDLQIESGFRTYEEQRALRRMYEAGTGNLAAKAGYSNHQNGIALDLNTGGFGTDLYTWMTQHAPALGYLRTVSGEHWHWEYHPDEAATLAKASKFKRAGVTP